MKKTYLARLVAVVLALVMMLGSMTGCAQQEMPAQFGGVKAAEATEVTEETTEEVTEETKEVAEETEEVTEETKEVAEETEEVAEETEEVAEETEEVTEETEEVAEETEEVAEETEEVAEETEEVAEETEEVAEETEEGRCTPAVEVIEGAVYCDVDYFLERVTVVFEDDTAALKAATEGDDVILDDVHAIGGIRKARDNEMYLPIQGGNVAITLDGEKAISVALHTHKNEWALCVEEQMETGFVLKQCSKVGVEAEWLQVTAVCVENADAEFGYDFFVLVNEECVPDVVYTYVYTGGSTTEETTEEEITEDTTEEDKDDEDPYNPGGGTGGGTGGYEEDSDHNDLDEIPNPNPGGEDVDPGHNGLEGIYNPNEGNEIDTTLQPEDSSNDEGAHSGFDSNDSSESMDNVVDTTLNPEDSSNDEGTHSTLSDVGASSDTTVVIRTTSSRSTFGNTGSSSAHSSLN